MHNIAGLKFPAQLARISVQRIKISVAAAEVNCAVHHRRTGEKDIEDIGIGLGFRLPTMQSFRFETAFTFRGKFPFHRAAVTIKRIEFTVVAAHVDDAMIDRWSAGHWTTRGGFPNLPPALCIYRVHIPIVTSEVDDVGFHHRRTHHPRSGGKFPLHPMELARRGARVNASVRGVAAEHRLSLGSARQTHEQKNKDRSFHKAPQLVRRRVTGISSGP